MVPDTHPASANQSVAATPPRAADGLTTRRPHPEVPKTQGVHFRPAREGAVVHRRRAFSRLPTLVHLRRTASAFPEQPARRSSRAGERGTSRVPHTELPRMRRSQTARGPPATRANATGDVAFRLVGRRRYPGIVISRLNSPACAFPCQRFARALTDADA